MAFDILCVFFIKPYNFVLLFEIQMASWGPKNVYSRYKFIIT